MTLPAEPIYWLEQRSADVPNHDDWLTSAERLRMETFRVPKRRSDWRLGRWTAKCAAAAYFGWGTNRFCEIEIGAEPSGAPILMCDDGRVSPEISISHSSDVSLCAIGPPGVWVGCDVERAESRSQTFLETFFTGREIAALDGLTSNEQGLVANVMWSTKESYLKATRDGLRRDTTEFEVAMSGGPLLRAGWVVQGIWHQLWIWDGRNRYAAFWRYEDGFVQTVTGGKAWAEEKNAVLRALAIPEPLGGDCERRAAVRSLVRLPLPRTGTR